MQTERTAHPDRKQYKKLTDKKIMKQVLIEKDWVTAAKLRNQIIIDNTNLSADKVAEKIIKEFDLK